MQTVKPKEMEISKEGRVKAEFWNVNWLPIASDAGNNYLCVDFDPALGGSKGHSDVFRKDGPASQGLSRSDFAESPRVPASAGLSLDLT